MLDSYKFSTLEVSCLSLKSRAVLAKLEGLVCLIQAEWFSIFQLNARRSSKQNNLKNLNFISLFFSEQGLSENYPSHCPIGPEALNQNWIKTELEHERL